MSTLYAIDHGRSRTRCPVATRSTLGSLPPPPSSPISSVLFQWRRGRSTGRPLSLPPVDARSRLTPSTCGVTANGLKDPHVVFVCALQTQTRNSALCTHIQIHSNAPQPTALRLTGLVTNSSSRPFVGAFEHPFISVEYFEFQYVGSSFAGLMRRSRSLCCGDLRVYRT